MISPAIRHDLLTLMVVALNELALRYTEQGKLSEVHRNMPTLIMCSLHTL